MALEEEYSCSGKSKLKVYTDKAYFYDVADYWFPIVMVIMCFTAILGPIVGIATNSLTHNPLLTTLSIISVILISFFIGHELNCHFNGSHKPYEENFLAEDDGQVLLATILAQKTNITDGEKIYLNYSEMKTIKNYCSNIRKMDSNKNIENYSVKLDKHLENFNLKRENNPKGLPSVELIEATRQNAKSRVERDSAINGFKNYIGNSDLEALLKASENYNNLSKRSQDNLNEIIDTFAINVKRCEDSVGTVEHNEIRDNIATIIKSVMPTVREYMKVNGKSLSDSSKVDAIYILDKYGK